MSKETALIRRTISQGLFPITYSTRTFIRTPCPSCQRQMMVFQKFRLSKERIFKCICGYHLAVEKKEYEAITGKCIICGKRNCCARDHSFHGELIGMGF